MEYTSGTDQELLDECSKNSVQAFNTLFDRYSSGLFAYAKKYLKDDFQAEEAMMDVMLWIWNNRLNLKIEGELRFYLFRSVKHATIKQIRKSAAKFMETDILENDLRFSSPAADQALLHQELKNHYHQSIALLSPQRKIAFELSRERKLNACSNRRQAWYICKHG
ncbi:sigma factor [Pedobacter lithocola]|uniref:Sigma factor n=1 Tax=Pedobacter lithocola TaxID=1908239 RepID=A0ABV8P709_9SPHI